MQRSSDEPEPDTPTSETLSKAWLLCHRASKGDLVALQRALEEGARLDVADYDGRTPLHLAAAGGHLPVVRFLVEAAGCAMRRDRFGSLPTDDAQRGGHQEVKAYLRALQGDGRTSPTQDVDSALHAWELCHTAHVGDLEALRRALRRGEDLSLADYDGRTALHLAAASGHLDVVRFLVEEAGCPLLKDRFGSLPVDDAHRGGHQEVKRYLLQVAGDLSGSPSLAEGAGPLAHGWPAGAPDGDVPIMSPAYEHCARLNPGLQRVHSKAIRTFCGPEREDTTIVQHRFSNGFVVSVVDTQNASGSLLATMKTTLPHTDHVMHATDSFVSLDDSLALCVFHYCADPERLERPGEADVQPVVRFSESVQLGQHVPEFQPQPDYCPDHLSAWLRRGTAYFVRSTEVREVYRLYQLDRGASLGHPRVEWRPTDEATMEADLPPAYLPDLRARKRRNLEGAFWLLGCVHQANARVMVAVCQVLVSFQAYVERVHSHTVWGADGAPVVTFRFLVYVTEPGPQRPDLGETVVAALREALAAQAQASPALRPAPAPGPTPANALSSDEDCSSGNDETVLEPSEGSGVPAKQGELVGYLLKQNQRGVIRLWQKRKVELSGSILTYVNPREPHLFKSFDLNNFTLGHCDARRFAFSLTEVGGKTVLRLACATETERRQWWTAITAAQRGAAVAARGGREAEPDRDPEWEAEGELMARYQRVCLLGRGTSGKVWKVRDRETSELLAMKVMDKGHIARQQLAKSVLTEKGILENLRHPFVIRLHGAFQTPTKLCLVLDYLPGGTLQLLLDRWSHLQEPLARFYATEMALALAYLHSCHVIHRDLKPTNVLLTTEGHAVVTDFGIATSAAEASTFCGTPHYLAPEILARRPYTKAVDWWCFGVLLYQMLTGSLPFLSQTGLSGSTVYRNILEETPNFQTALLSPAATSLLQGLLAKDPEGRTGYERLTKHPFFSGVDWDAALRLKIPRPFLPEA